MARVDGRVTIACCNAGSWTSLDAWGFITPRTSAAYLPQKSYSSVPRGTVYEHYTISTDLLMVATTAWYDWPTAVPGLDLVRF